ncbi:MAG TPA: low molecular weight protein arginine phosphatase [Tissierellia bacterium]|nr:low molecular weight protein arginine phosphatase [Tissierellia bacterium]
MNILFVCTGNTCRSPMAEGIFKNMLKENNIEGINVSSAGISVFPGETANEKSISALKEMGIDIRDHRARQLTDEIMNTDLILTMTLNHKRIIEDYYKHRKEKLPKIYTLKEFAAKISGEKPLKLDIDDPYGRSHHVYKKTRDEIIEDLKKILKNIDKLEEI